MNKNNIESAISEGDELLCLEEHADMFLSVFYSLFLNIDTKIDNDEDIEIGIKDYAILLMREAYIRTFYDGKEENAMNESETITVDGESRYIISIYCDMLNGIYERFKDDILNKKNITYYKKTEHINKELIQRITDEANMMIDENKKEKDKIKTDNTKNDVVNKKDKIKTDNTKNDVVNKKENNKNNKKDKIKADNTKNDVVNKKENNKNNKKDKIKKNKPEKSKTTEIKTKKLRKKKNKDVKD